MAAKRASPSANGGRSESPTRSGGSKRLCSGRHDQGCTLQELMEKLNPSDLQMVFNILCRGSTLQEFMEKQNPSDLLPAFNILCRGCTLQEFVEKLNPSDLQRVEDLCRKYRVNVPLSSRTRICRLQFRNKLQDLFTDKILLAENDMEVEIAIVDASNMVINSGPEAKSVIEIFVLDGDYNGECTENEFKKHVIIARKHKPPLLLGNLFIQLCDGVGYITDAKFTDNSSWTKSKNFKLGARLYRGEGMAGKVQEGISKAFRVKDRHGEKYRKDRPRSMNDDVCYLKGISKDGSNKKKLADLNINTVGDFLSYCRDNSPETLRTMIGMKERPWKKTYGHAIESEVCSAIIPNNPFSLPTHDQTIGMTKRAWEETYGHATGSESLSDIIRNIPDSLLALGQNYSKVAGSNSSMISNVCLQLDGIMPSTSNVESNSDVLAIAQSLPATKSGFVSSNSVEEIVITGGIVWKGTEQLGIPPEVQMEGDGGRSGPKKFGHIWLQLFYVARWKFGVRRSLKPRPHNSDYHNARDLSYSFGSWPQCNNISPPDEDIDEITREEIYGHATESESWINDILRNSPVNHLPPDQFYLEMVGSNSSQIPNSLLQPYGIMQSPSNFECESYMFTIAQSVPATTSGYELPNSDDEIGGMVWKRHITARYSSRGSDGW